MFTGIITGLGHIVEAKSLGANPSHGKQLVLQAPAGYLDDVQLGDSISLNGACNIFPRTNISPPRSSVSPASTS
jgi:riboflavin synthase